MSFLELFLDNLLTLPILAFSGGIIFAVFFSDKQQREESKLRQKTEGAADGILRYLYKYSSFLTFFLLFSIGLKGGRSLVEHANIKALYLLSLLVAWGLIQPFISYGILRRFTKVDKMTAAAIAACFGSISVMTYMAAANFLEKLEISYDGLVIAALAIMEVPAILSGLFLSRTFGGAQNRSLKKIGSEVFLNTTVLMLVGGMAIGGFCSVFEWNAFPTVVLAAFKPVLCLFLFYLGSLVGKHRDNLREFSWPLILFGIYTPLIGGIFGILLSYFLQINPGTGTLIAILTASASYIAVPAAMRIALPEAKEAIYLPLSLGIAFPFNVVIGIPLFYQIALKL